MKFEKASSNLKSLIRSYQNWHEPKITKALDKIQRICNAIGFDLASWLQSFSIAGMQLPCAFFCKYFHANYPNEFSSLVHRLHEFKRWTRLMARIHYFIVEIAKWSRMFYSNTFFFCTPRVRDFLSTSFIFYYVLEFTKI